MDNTEKAAVSALVALAVTFIIPDPDVKVAVRFACAVVVVGSMLVDLWLNWRNSKRKEK